MYATSEKSDVVSVDVFCSKKRARISGAFSVMGSDLFNQQIISESDFLAPTCRVCPWILREHHDEVAMQLHSRPLIDRGGDNSQEQRRVSRGFVRLIAGGRV